MKKFQNPIHHFNYTTLLCVSFFLVFCGNLLGQQTELVDFKRIQATIEPLAESQSVEGTVRVSFEVLKRTDSIYLDAKSMKITESALEGVTVSAEKDKIWLIGPFEANRSYTAYFSYKAIPKQTLYFTGNQIWTQGQGKYTSHWLPSIDDMNDKIEFDLTVVASLKKKVVANGKLTETFKRKQKKFWKWDMQQPISSYLVAFVVGDFAKKELKSKSGIPIELYFEVKDAPKAEPTYRYTKEIFDFLEAEIDVPYPWQNYKQVPVRDFLYAGMENTTATIFSEAFVVDSIGFNDRNYVKVNAHELAHQWFGNLVTETSSEHHWLHEGFATYYALLAEKQIFGEDYYYWQLYNSAEQLDELSKNGKGESLLNPKASSLTFYEKGAWALHMLKELIGEKAFNKGVKSYLEKFQFENVSIANFLEEVRSVSQYDISLWEKDWLEQSAFKTEQAFNSLTKSSFIKEYFEMSALRPLGLDQKYKQLEKALDQPNDYIGQEVVIQLSLEEPSKVIALYKRALSSNNLLVRRAVAEYMPKIPIELRSDAESLLKDKSYITIELALFNLWSSFPENRAAYLDRTKNIIGFQNKNIRRLWLALAYSTKGYDEGKKEIYIEELRRYTSPEFSFEIRQETFGYLYELGALNDQVLRNLVNACVHHNWRFRTYVRRILDLVLEDEAFKSQLSKMMSSLSQKEQAYLNKALLK